LPASIDICDDIHGCNLQGTSYSGDNLQVISHGKAWFTVLGVALTVVVVGESVGHANCRRAVLAGVSVDQVQLLLAAWSRTPRLLHHLVVVCGVAPLRPLPILMPLASGTAAHFYTLSGSSLLIP
jgi:hypothetical protein